MIQCFCPKSAGPADFGREHQQNQKALVLWFGLVVLVGKKSTVQI
jgi:hypothetical protein